MSAVDAPGDAEARPGDRTTAASAPPFADGWTLAIVALAGIQPFTAFAVANAGRLVRPLPVVLAGLAWMLLTVAAFLVVRLLTRSSPPLPWAATVAVVSLSFWNFGRIFPSEPESAVARWVALGVWLLLTALLVVLVRRLVTLSWARSFLVAMLAIWVGAAVLQAGLVRAQATGGDTPAEYAGPPFGDFVERPNVYWFVLDGHPRTDQLEEVTGRSNAWFGDDLRARGFSVSESSQTGYVETHLSIPSTLAMEYRTTPGNDYRSIYLGAAEVIAGDNPVVEAFEANGYRYVYAPDGSIEWAACPDLTGDRACIRPENATFGLREPYSALVQSTPVGSFPVDLTHNTLDSVLDGLDELDVADDQPVFFFSHLLTPHFPHRYEADCSMRDDWVVGTTLTGEERAANHAVDTECVDREVIAAVDRILTADPDAVIIVQSDHGSRLTFNFSTTYEEMTPRALTEGFAVLNAIRLPEACREESIEGEPLVNTFRIVLACLSGTEPDRLPTRTFFATFGRVDTLVEVPPERFEPSS